MAHTHQYLIYNIHLTDQAQVAAFQHAGTGASVGAVLSAPDKLTLQFTAPKLRHGDPFVAPSLTSDYFDIDFPTDVDTFDRKSGGWFGVSWLFGDTVTYHWRGIYVYSPPSTVPGVGAPINIAPRRWIDGFEIPDPDGNAGGPEGSGPNDNRELTPLASRHTSGMGFAWRNFDNGIRRTHTPIENLGGTAPNKSWERFYLRLRRAPAAQTRFWWARCATTGSWAFEMMPSGQIAVGWVSSGGAFTLVGASPTLVLNKWTKIDVRFWFGAVGVGGNQFELWINGVIVLSGLLAGTLSGGPGEAGQLHIDSNIGSIGANTMALDVDDWICGDHMGAPDGVDFQNGSRVVLVRANGLDAASHDFAGDWRWCLVNPIDGSDPSLLASSTTGAKLVVTTDAADSVDALQESLGAVALQLHVRQIPGDTTADLFGCSSAALAIAPAAITQLTAAWWKKPFTRLTGTPTAVRIAPLTISYEKVSNNSTKIAHLSATVELIGSFGKEDLGPTAPQPNVLPAATGPHNNPYPRTPWARQTTAPMQPVYVKTGSYVGTGTFVDLDFPAPIHMLWRRQIGGGADHWWSTQVGAHSNEQSNGFASQNLVQAMQDGAFVPGTTETNVQVIDRNLWNAKMQTEGRAPTPADTAYWRGAIGADPAAIVAGVLIDFWVKKLLGQGSTGVDIPSHGPYASPVSALLPLPAGVSFVGDSIQQTNYKIRIVGNGLHSNRVGETYQYLAIGDPGQRFMTNGGLSVSRGALDAVTQLFHQGFTPVGLFIRPEQTLGIQAIAFYKGPGHPPSSLNDFTTGELTNAVQVALHQITTKSAFHTAIVDAAVVPFSALRIDDLSGHAGSVFQIFSYTGDGTGTRVIACTPASTKRPLFAFIFPHNSTGRFRDPAHLSGTSSTISGGAGAAGIVAGGIDAITVDALLNTNAVVYDALVIPGGTDAGIDGWSLGGEFWPVPPEPPPGAPGQEDGGGPVPGADPGTDGGTGGGGTLPDPLAPTGPMPSLTDDLDPACEPDTRRIINVALTRLGLSKQIANVATDLVAEASQVRLVYNDAIQDTLRDFPWPFATRYAQLAAVGTGRPNSDWLYSYRQPSDCLFERRIVISRTDVLNPDGIPFQLSSDDTGGLIFTNLANVVLEYTARPKCVHTRSEPLFRDAAAWKLAGALAPALTRMPEKVASCQKEYDSAIRRAYVVLRPGNPGEMPGAGTLDQTAPQKAANVNAVNMALVKIGAPTIVNLSTDQSRSAQVARLVFEHELRATLRDFPWPFSTAYTTPTLVGGTNALGVNADWQYSYRLPDDLVFARRMVTSYGRAYERNPPTFKLAQDASGGLLYTDQGIRTNPAGPVLEYTSRPDGAVAIADPLFLDALIWRLAWAMAPTLAQIMPERPEAVGRGPDEVAAGAQSKTPPSTGTQLRQKAAGIARECYYFALATAKTVAANESEPNLDNPDADWIAGRG